MPVASPALTLRLWIRLVAGLVAVGVSLSASAQPPFGEIRFAHLSLEDGLSQVTVNHILQDRTGFIWFGTQDGLNRFDGYRFVTFRHDLEGSDSLSHDVVTILYEDDGGILWVGTEGGLSRYRPDLGTFVRFQKRDDDSTSLSGNRVRAICEDRVGDLWVGTLAAGLNRLDTTSGTFQRYRHDPNQPGSLSDDRVRALYRDRDGLLWVGTAGGLNRYDPGSDTFVHYKHDPAVPNSLANNDVRAITEDKNGVLWVGTKAGLDRLDFASGSFEHLRHSPEDPATLSHDHVRTLVVDHEGRLWAGTEAGLNLVTAPRGPVLRFRHDPLDPTSLGDDRIMALYQDAGEVLWIGTHTAGLSRWNPAIWSFVRYRHDPADSQGLSSDVVTAFAEAPADQIWVGTWGGGLDRLDPATGTFTALRHDPGDARTLTDNRVTALATGSEDKLWVGTFQGLNRIDLKTDTIDRYRHDPEQPGSLPRDRITALYRNRDGMLLVGTYGGGVVRYDAPQDSFERLPIADQSAARAFSGARITSFAEDGAGRLWVGTEFGVTRFDPETGGLARLGHDPSNREGLRSDAVTALYYGAGDTLWIGTHGGGLHKLSRTAAWDGVQRVASFGEGQGLPSDVIHGIESDAEGNLWLSTNDGVARFNPLTESVTRYGLNHGLQSIVFNAGAHFQTADGTIYFGGVDGFNSFDPTAVQINSHVPPVIITKLTSVARPLSLPSPGPGAEAVALRHTDRLVTFEFAALDYTWPQANRYAYRLEGLNDEWVELGTENRVSFTSLPARHFVLRVRGSNHDGVWNEAGVEVAIDMLPPPWRTPWAYSLYAFLLILFLAGMLRLQAEQRRQKEAYQHKLEEEVTARTQELALRNAQLEGLNQQLEEASVADSLTGLKNRRYLIRQVEQETALALRRYRNLKERGGSDTSPPYDLLFVMVDLDGYKDINDRYGHAAGDWILLQVCDILVRACRTSDTVVRWGGDEFLVLGRELHRSQIDALAERIRVMVETYPFEVRDGEITRMTVSVGFACFPFLLDEPEALNWEQVVAIADKALYLAKDAGRNAWIGLAACPGTSAEALLARLDDAGEDLIRDGLLEASSSVPMPTSPVRQS